jgi:hypothetical protein
LDDQGCRGIYQLNKTAEMSFLFYLGSFFVVCVALLPVVLLFLSSLSSLTVYFNKYNMRIRYWHCSEADFLNEIQTKVLRVFLLAIHGHLYSFAL